MLGGWSMSEVGLWSAQPKALSKVSRHLAHTSRCLVPTARFVSPAASHVHPSEPQAGSTSIVEGEKEAWWLDDRTKRLIEQTMRLNGTLTFTVRPGTPLQLTREQVPRQRAPTSVRRNAVNRATVRN